MNVAALASQLQAVAADLGVVRAELSALKARPNITQRTLFTHWGRTQCDFQAQTVYSGWAGASMPGQTGSGGNMLCMAGEAGYNNLANPTVNGGAVLTVVEMAFQSV